MRARPALAALVAVAAWARLATAQPPEPGAEPAAPDTEPAPELLPGQVAPPAPREEPVREPAPSGPAPVADAAVIDESAAPPGAKPAEDPVCVTCALIATGTVILIGTVPLGAQLDGALRRVDRLHRWVETQGGNGGDLGFIAGYGFAKAHDDQLKYGIATGVVGGVGAIIFFTGVGLVAKEGGFTKGPKPSLMNGVRVGAAELIVTPTFSPDGGGAAVGVAF